MFYRIPFASAPRDLTGLTGIRMKVRSDEPRILRLDIDSPKNTAANQGVEFGWEVQLGVTATTVTVSFANAKVPSWATDPGDSLAGVLQSATALMFRHECNHVDGTGHLPVGVTDNGWVDIDDIEFF